MKRSYIGIAAVAILVAAVCIRAGFWQLDRLEQRRDRNSAIHAAGLLPPLELNPQLARALHQDPRPYLYRRLTARGTYLHGTEVLLRGRALEGMPGVHLVTALRTSPEDPPLPVLRGWMPAPDGASADPRSLRSGAIVTVHGMVLPLVEGGEPRPVHIALEGDSLLTARSLDVSLLATMDRHPPLPVVLQRLPGVEDAGDEPIPVPLPELGDGPHLGYALQWFGFAAVALLGPLLLLFRHR
jgi:surfeit locus 1 family protein